MDSDIIDTMMHHRDVPLPGTRGEYFSPQWIGDTPTLAQRRSYMFAYFAWMTSSEGLQDDIDELREDQALKVAKGFVKYGRDVIPHGYFEWAVDKRIWEAIFCTSKVKPIWPWPEKPASEPGEPASVVFASLRKKILAKMRAGKADQSTLPEAASAKSAPEAVSTPSTQAAPQVATKQPSQQAAPQGTAKQTAQPAPAKQPIRQAAVKQDAVKQPPQQAAPQGTAKPPQQAAAKQAPQQQAALKQQPAAQQAAPTGQGSQNLRRQDDRDQGYTQVSYQKHGQGGNNRGNYQGGNYRGGHRGGHRGGNRGNYQGGHQGNYRGGNQGAQQGDSQAAQAKLKPAHVPEGLKDGILQGNRSTFTHVLTTGGGVKGWGPQVPRQTPGHYWKLNGKLYLKEPFDLPSPAQRRRLWQALCPGIPPQGDGFELELPAELDFEALVWGNLGIALSHLKERVADKQVVLTWRYKDRPQGAVDATSKNEEENMPKAKVARMLVLGLADMDWSENTGPEWHVGDHDYLCHSLMQHWDIACKWLLGARRGRPATLAHFFMAKTYPQPSAAYWELMTADLPQSNPGEQAVALGKYAACRKIVARLFKDCEDNKTSKAVALNQWLDAPNDGMEMSRDQRIQIASDLWNDGLVSRYRPRGEVGAWVAAARKRWVT